MPLDMFVFLLLVVIYLSRIMADISARMTLVSSPMSCDQSLMLQ